MKTEKNIDPILKLASKAQEAYSTSKDASTLDGIPYGRHDEALMAFLGLARRKYALSDEALIRLEMEGIKAVLQDYDPNDRPFTLEDARRHVQFLSDKPSDPQFEIKREVREELGKHRWKRANEIPEEDEVTRIEWILYRFIPQHELTFQYGNGGIGKSTWVPWLISTLLLRGMKVGFSASEESFVTFRKKVYLSLPEEHRSLDILANLCDIEDEWTFPGDQNKLKEYLTDDPLDFIYFDSIYDIFDCSGGGAMVNTRKSLSPLSRIAKTFKVSILGTFHENKSSKFNGSKEMENVPRALNHATKIPSSGNLKLHVEKSNYKKPEKDIVFYGEWVKDITPSGVQVKELNEDGEWVDNEVFIVKGYNKVNKKEELDDEDTSITIVDKALETVRECRERNPKWGWSRIADETGISKSIVQSRLDKLKKEKLKN